MPDKYVPVVLFQNSFCAWTVSVPDWRRNRVIGVGRFQPQAPVPKKPSIRNYIFVLKELSKNFATNSGFPCVSFTFENA